MCRRTPSPPDINSSRSEMCPQPAKRLCPSLPCSRLFSPPGFSHLQRCQGDVTRGKSQQTRRIAPCLSLRQALCPSPSPPTLPLYPLPCCEVPVLPKHPALPHGSNYLPRGPDSLPHESLPLSTARRRGLAGFLLEGGSRWE